MGYQVVDGVWGVNTNFERMNLAKDLARDAGHLPITEEILLRPYISSSGAGNGCPRL